MRFLIAVVCGLSLSLFSQASHAQEEVQGQLVITPELVDAHIAFKQAQARVHNYRNIVLPTAQRRLSEQIRLAETEIAILQRRLRDYRPFLRVGDYSPVRTAAESHVLALTAAQQRLNQLKDDRIALMRTTRQQFDFQNLEIVRAAAHYQRCGAIWRGRFLTANRRESTRIIGVLFANLAERFIFVADAG